MQCGYVSVNLPRHNAGAVRQQRACATLHKEQKALTFNIYQTR